MTPRCQKRMDTIRLWQHEKVGLIGRDKLLSQHILPRINSHDKRFLIKGDAGTGKTAILEWAQTNTPGKSILIRGSATYAQIVKDIVLEWELDAEGTKLTDYEKAILSETGHTIYIDDLHKAQPKLLALLKILAERHKVCGSILSGIKTKEELKQLLWGLETITLPRLDRQDALRLAEKICITVGSRASHKDVGAASRGLPGRIVAFATAGEISRKEVHLQSEKTAIAPLVVVVVTGLMLFRFVGRVTGETDLTFIGGASMMLLLVVRMLLQGGKR